MIYEENNLLETQKSKYQINLKNTGHYHVTVISGHYHVTVT